MEGLFSSFLFGFCHPTEAVEKRSSSTSIELNEPSRRSEPMMSLEKSREEREREIEIRVHNWLCSIGGGEEIYAVQLSISEQHPDGTIALNGKPSMPWNVEEMH